MCYPLHHEGMWELKCICNYTSSFDIIQAYFNGHKNKICYVYFLFLMGKLYVYIYELFCLTFIDQKGKIKV